MAEEKKTNSSGKKATRRRTPKPKAEQDVAAKATKNAEAEVTEAIATSVEVAPEVEVEVREENDDIKALMEEIKLLRAERAADKEEIEKLKNQRPQVVQLAGDTEMIEFLWLAPVSDNNELLIADGMYGKITGKVGNFSVPKREFSRVLDSATRKYIENRWLIVLSGLSDEERRMYGVDYKPGEVLTKETFMRLPDMGAAIIPVYKELCDASKEVVAKLYYETWMDPKQRHKVDRATVVALNKAKGNRGWKAIIEEMNRAEAE